MPFVDNFQSAMASTDHVVDAIFGSHLGLARMTLSYAPVQYSDTLR